MLPPLDTPTGSTPRRRLRPLLRVVALLALVPILWSCGAAPSPVPPDAGNDFEDYLDRAVDGELVDEVRFEIGAVAAAQGTPAGPPSPVPFRATRSSAVTRKTPMWAQ